MIKLFLFAMLFILFPARGAQFKVANAVHSKGRLSIAIDDNSEQIGLSKDKLSDAIELEEGGHKFSIFIDEEKLYQFKINCADKDKYLVVLYGIGDKKVEKSIWAKAKTFLGGFDERSIDQYQITHKVMVMRPQEEGKTARARLMNASMGPSSLTAVLDRKGKKHKIGAAKYGGSTKATYISPNAYKLSISLANHHYIDTKEKFGPGSDSVIVVTGFEGDKIAWLIDQRKPGE